MEEGCFARDELARIVDTILLPERKLICRDEDFRFGQSIQDFLDISGGGSSGYKHRGEG